jgi:hypothetical protein
VLPQWLANPSVVSVNLQQLTTTVKDIPGLDHDIVRALKRNNITHFFPGNFLTLHKYTVCSESCCALRLRYVCTYVRVEVCIDTHEHHFQHLLSVHSDFLNVDLQKVFANKIKWVQVWCAWFVLTFWRTYCLDLQVKVKQSHYRT